MMPLGRIVRPKIEPLGTALNAGAKPLWKTQPRRFDSVNHWKTGKPMGPPTYHKNHPTLTGPVQKPVLPVKSTLGPNQNQLNAYVKALQRG